MDVAALVISVLALGTAGLAAWYSHRQAAAAERSATADEQNVELAALTASRYSPPWVLQWFQGDAYLLRNESDEPTHGVEIDLGDIRVVRGELTHDRIGPGSAVKFMAGRSMGTQNDTVTVKWRRQPGGDILDWSQPLPAKPRG